MSPEIKQEILLKLAFHEGFLVSEAFNHSGKEDPELRRKVYFNMGLTLAFLQKQIFEVTKLSNDQKIFLIKKHPPLNNFIWNKTIEHLCKNSKKLNKQFKKLNLSIKTEDNENS